MSVSIEDLERASVAKHYPDQTPYRSISVESIRQLAATSNATGGALEVAALENGIVPERYARNMRTFSLPDQAALLKARAGVVGLGGLGGAVTEILARLGLGHLTLVDGDRFEDSNLNRQLLSSCGTLGRSKADAARKRVGEINPSVAVTARPEFLSAQNAARLLAGCDVVIDCLDNLKTRFVVQDACRSLGCPFVSAAVAGASGHVTTVFPEDHGLRLIYGAPETLPPKGAETVLGTVPYSVVFLGALECAEVVKIVLKKGTPLRNRLLIADLTDGIIDVMDLNPPPP
jgi:molybdopterin/thiamine biosynthesis adenylyltransferase